MDPSASVQYRFEAAPGYENVLVAIDDDFAPATGSVTMDRSHVLYVTADRTVALHPDDRTLLEGLRLVYTATEPRCPATT